MHTRRTFIQNSIHTVSGSFLLASGSPHVSAASSPSREGRKGVQLAIATICTDGFGNKQHKPAFRHIPELGYRNVEFNLWYPNTMTRSYIGGLRERSQKAGLTPVCLQGSPFGAEGSAAVLKDYSHKMLLMERALQIGCKLVKCTGSARGTNGELKAVIEVCRELAPVARELGVRIVLENHAKNVLENIADYEQIFAAIDSPEIGMCLDTGHFEGMGIDLHEVIEKFHPRICHVDLKDCKERGAGHNTVPFGEGVTDFDAFLNHLFSKSYSGYLVIEQAWIEPKGDWLNNLKLARERFLPYASSPV